MDTLQLKEYIRRAKELEAAIYMQNKLAEGHLAVLDAQVPRKPEKEVIRFPERPTAPGSLTGKIFGLILGILCIVVSFFFFSDGSIGWGLAYLVFGALWVLGAIALAIDVVQEKKKYEFAYMLYKRETERCFEAQKEAKRAFEEAEMLYQRQRLQNSLNKASEERKHAEVLESLVEVLKLHYSENIVFEKYRDIVAISAIDEYLSSGRCEKLEGPDGAYNLYEMELRQNIIIGQLSSIVVNLERIKANQYTLYQELSNANVAIDQILCELRDVRDNTKLTAHFARMAALAAAAPRYTYTI